MKNTRKLKIKNRLSRLHLNKLIQLKFTACDQQKMLVKLPSFYLFSGLPTVRIVREYCFSVGTLPTMVVVQQELTELQKMSIHLELLIQALTLIHQFPDSILLSQTRKFNYMYFSLILSQSKTTQRILIELYDNIEYEKHTRIMYTLLPVLYIKLKQLFICTN